MKILRRAAELIGLLICFLILILLFPYLLSPIYKYPDTNIFEGTKIYNPYSELSGIKIKANFHAHSKYGLNLTYGEDTPQKVVDTYTKMNFDLITLSNYHSINPKIETQKIYIPNYEHGINIFKNHFLVVGAKEVDYLNYIFYQTINHKQFQINRLKDDAEFLIISHPALRDGYSSYELKNLSNYDAMEIHSNYTDSEVLWDSVLSAGRPIWGINNDDSHDMGDSSKVGKYWNYIFPSSRNEKDIIKALKSGKFVSVQSKMGLEDNFLNSLNVTDSTIILDLAKPAKLINYIGQNGKLMYSEKDKSNSTYTFSSSDTYIRVVVINDSSKFYFNPVYRYISLPKETRLVTINIFYSVIYWIITSSLFLLIGFAIIKRMRYLYKRI